MSPGEVARHRELAGQAVEAGRQWLVAGREAFEGGSARAALRALGRACDLLPEDLPEALGAAGLLERAWERSGRAEGRVEAAVRFRRVAALGGDMAALCDGYNRLGRAYLDGMELDRAEEVLRDGLSLARQHTVVASEGKALAYLGYLARNRGDYPEAAARCEQALARFEAESLHADLAATWTILGIVRRQTGRPEEAVECYRRSLEAQERGRNETVREATYINLALAEDTLGNHWEALAWLRRALALNREIGNRRRTGLIHGNRGDVYLELGRPDLAYHCVRKAAQLARERSIPVHEGVALVSLARLELERGRQHESEMALTYAAAVAADTVSHYLDSHVALARISLWLAKGAHEAALAEAEAARERTQEAGLAAEEALARARASVALRALGRRDEASHQAKEAVAKLPEGALIAEVEVCLARYAAEPATGAAQLERAVANVRSRAAKIPSERLRASFLARPYHAQVLAAAGC